jgi:uncharacterized protein (TIGR00288 family)
MKARHAHLSTPRAPVAPLHRGPQAHAHQAGLTAPTPVHAPNAALLIDFDNVTMGIRSDLQTELRNLLSSDIIQGKVAVQRAYADWRRYPQYIVPLSEASIDLIFAPAYGSSKKNATDIRLAIDALELVFTRPEIGTFILLSGDSDFSSLVIKLKEYGKYVIGVGIRESSSDLLVQNCDEYYSYNALAGLVKAGEEESAHKWDPWELVAEAIGRMRQNNDVMRSDRLKQVMQEIDNAFDEKDLGMSKFSKFCHEAAHRGLLKVTKLENGQLEVAPPPADAAPRGEAPPSRRRAPRRVEAEPAERVADQGDAPATDAAPADDTEARPEREGRTRRGRRGGRGRKRGEAAPGDVGGEGTPDTAAESAPTPAEVRAVDLDAEAVEAPHAAAAPQRRRTAPEPADAIGLSGLRLTRDEAMALVRDAILAATTGDESVSDAELRRKAFEILGRDSESLAARHFSRILRDAHDADIVDLRRRGDAFEVARAAAAASVADQLAEREEAARAAEPAPVGAPPQPRGMGPRGAPARGRGASSRSVPPPDLLMVGVVDGASPQGSPEPRATGTDGEGA